MKITLLAIVASLAVLVAGPVDAAKPKPIVACRLLRVADVQPVLGTPVALHRGGTASDCIVRASDKVPVVVLANTSGTRGFSNLMRAQGPPFVKLRNVGTQAVTYDHVSEDPQGVQRGVIVRKGVYVVQLNTSDVGMVPPGLPTLAQLVKLTRAAVKRLP